MKKILTIAALFFASITLAQSFGGSLMVGYPQGEFRKNVDRIGYGIEVHGALWSPSLERPFTIGLNVSYLVYGEVKENRPWIGIPGVYLDLSRTNSMANLHLMMQVSPFMGTVRPYLEGLFGGAYIFTTSTVKSESSTQDIASSTNFDDFAWNYGGGVGILFKLTDQIEGIDALYLDIKARYLFGTEAEYLTEESLQYIKANGEPVFKSQKSKTDFFTFHIGVQVNLL
jgi:hypothetical protein